MIGAAIGALVGIAGTAMNFYSQYQSAKELKKLAAYQMKAAEQEARNVTMQSHENASRARVDAQSYLNEVQTQVAGMSGMVNSDSMLEAQGKAGSVLELQIQDAARAEKMRARNILQQASVGAYQSNQQSEAMRISAFSDLVSGMTKVGLHAKFGFGSNTQTNSPASIITPKANYSSKDSIINATK